MRIQVCVLAPDRIFRVEEVDELILPTRTGQIGVMRNHAALITALDIGVRIFRRTSDWEPLALMGGFALVQKNQVTILVNEAISACEIEAREAKTSLERATEYLRQVSEEKDKIEAIFSFKRARARYQVTRSRKES